jgi:hypothetical protein
MAALSAAAGKALAAREGVAASSGLGVSSQGAFAGRAAFNPLSPGPGQPFAADLKLDPVRLGEGVLRRAEAFRGGLEGRETASPFSAPRVFEAKGWTEWKPTAGERVDPRAVAERFSPFRDAGNVETYARHLVQSDASFGEELGRRERQFREATCPAEQDKALLQLRKNTAGKLGESIATEGLRPYFQNVDFQHRVETGNGLSLVDGRFTGANNPITLGRGQGVPLGGNLSVEVKTGQPSYLDQQVGHLVDRQVPGHLASGDRSLVMISRDVYAMPGEREARDSVRDAGSYVMALLPEKRAMDQALVRMLSERLGRI